jgi:hypothetical protein
VNSKDSKLDGSQIKSTGRLETAQRSSFGTSYHRINCLKYSILTCKQNKGYTGFFPLQTNAPTESK